MEQRRDAPTIGIVIANYNEAENLEAAVVRYMDQSYEPDEIIVVDDGSEDESPTVLSDLGNRYPRLKVIRHEKNKGVNAAVESGVRSAASDYLHIASTHDPVENNFLQRMLQILEKNPTAGIAFSDPCVITSNGAKKVYRLHLSMDDTFFPPKKFQALQRRASFTIPSATTVFRRDALLEIGTFRSAFGRHADWYVNQSCAIRYGACYVPDHLAFYLEHNTTPFRPVYKWGAGERRTIEMIMQELENSENVDLWKGFRRCGILPSMGLHPLLAIGSVAKGRRFVTVTLVRHCIAAFFWDFLRPFIPVELRGFYRKICAVFPAGG